MIDQITYILLNAFNNGLIEAVLVGLSSGLILLGLMTLVAWTLPEYDSPIENLEN